MRSETLSGEQVRVILHISKRKMSWLLQNGFIKCSDTGKKTRRYTVLRKDLDAYIRQSLKHPERFQIPVGAFSSKKKKSRKKTYPIIPDSQLHSFRLWLEAFWERIPDILPVSDVSDLTGYPVTRLKQWKKSGFLQAVDVQCNTVIAKEWLIEFFCTDAFRIRTISNNHRKLLKRFIKNGGR